MHPLRHLKSSQILAPIQFHLLLVTCHPPMLLISNRWVVLRTHIEAEFPDEEVIEEPINEDAKTKTDVRDDWGAGGSNDWGDADDGNDGDDWGTDGNANDWGGGSWSNDAESVEKKLDLGKLKLKDDSSNSNRGNKSNQTTTVNTEMEEADEGYIDNDGFFEAYYIQVDNEPPPKKVVADKHALELQRQFEMSEKSGGNESGDWHEEYPHLIT